MKSAIATALAFTATPSPSPQPLPPLDLPAELLNPDQLARRLGISRRCLSTWTRNRLIPMIKIGRTCRFDLAKVRAALDQHERPAASPEPSPASCSNAASTASATR